MTKDEITIADLQKLLESRETRSFHLSGTKRSYLVRIITHTGVDCVVESRNLLNAIKLLLETVPPTTN